MIDNYSHLFNARRFATEQFTDPDASYAKKKNVGINQSYDHPYTGKVTEPFISSGFGFIDKYSHLFGARALAIEHFAINIGNTKNIKNKKSMQDISEIEKNIDQSKVIEGAASFVTKAANKAAASNKADLVKALAASNRLSIGSAKSSSGGFTLKNIKQKSEVKSSTDANFVQKISNKISTDLSNNLKNEVKSSTKQLTEDIKKKKEDVKESTGVGDTVKGLGNTLGKSVDNLVDTAGDILSVGIGNSTNEEKIEENMKSMKEKFNLNQSFKVKDNKSVSNDIENALSSENLAKCASEASAKNDLDIGKIDVKGDIVISDIAQESLIDDVMKCAFNQEVATEIATKIVSNYDNMIQQMIENVDSKLSDEQISKIQGDIYAAGVAGAAVLQAAGEGLSTAAQGAGKGLESTGKGLATAAEGAGKGISDASKGLGEGLSTAAKGVGEGVAKIASSLTGPLIAAAILGVIGLVGYIMFKRSKKGLDPTAGFDSMLPGSGMMYPMPPTIGAQNMMYQMPQYGAPMPPTIGAQNMMPPQFDASLPDALSATPTA